MKNNDAIGDALNIAATITFFQGNYTTTRSLLEEGLALHMVTENQRGRAYALSFLGYLIFCSEQNYVTAKALIEEGLACLKEMGDQRGIAKALYRLGCIAFKQGDFAATHTLSSRKTDDKRACNTTSSDFSSSSSFQGWPCQARFPLSR